MSNSFGSGDVAKALNIKDAVMRDRRRRWPDAMACIGVSGPHGWTYSEKDMMLLVIIEHLHDPINSSFGLSLGGAVRAVSKIAPLVSMAAILDNTGHPDAEIFAGVIGGEGFVATADAIPAIMKERNAPDCLSVSLSKAYIATRASMRHAGLDAN